MIKNIDYSLLPGFSKLFIEFINNNPFFMQRFPANLTLLDSANELKHKAEGFTLRDQLIPIISKTMSKVTLSPLQISNRTALNKSNSLAIVTGQQVGFLGGPLYTLYKAVSAIEQVRELNEKYKSDDLTFVPVFWVEDNDHDNLEASKLVLYDKDYNIHHIFCSNDTTKSDRTCVSEKMFNNEITQIIESIIHLLPESEHKSELSEKLRIIYQPGKRWTDAFVELLNSWLGEFGLLFISAEDVRKAGAFAPLINKEFQQAGKSEESVNSANQALEQTGFHIQAKVANINLFYHKDKNRYKIFRTSDSDSHFEILDENFSANDFNLIIQNHPERFSPNVILRNVFQDFVLPTAAYIAGPSEIGYIAQTKELYDYFGLKMPAILPRHSFTIITPRFDRFFSKQELKPDFFFRKFESIESVLLLQLKNIDLDLIVSDFIGTIEEQFEELNKHITQIDKTLINSSKATEHKITEQLQTLSKKALSVHKKQHTEYFGKYRQASNFFYPEGTMQERMFSPLNLISFFGEEKFIKLILESVKESSSKHLFVSLEKL
ncbi:MAG: bacillithiol biosynthesis cysteine-adding enzyme BshC [Bacteroidota bacterium]|jgi:bacillithiol biosynthesis cysteine-adding enzyme BshC